MSLYMAINHSMVVICFGGFIAQYFIMSLVKSNSLRNVTNTLGKFYLSLIMGMCMVVVEIMLHDHQYHVLSANLYLLLGGFITVLIYLYRNQVYIGDKQYAESIIENHATTLLTSQEILTKTNNYNVAKLAKNVIQSNKAQLQLIKHL